MENFVKELCVLYDNWIEKQLPYIINTVPETKIEREWIRNEILHCLQVLQDLGFKVRGVVCDDHSSNVSAFKKLLAIYGPSDNDLAIEYNNQKVYLFFDVVHLMKNIRNNLSQQEKDFFCHHFLLVNCTMK